MARVEGKPLLSLRIRNETDIVFARQRAKQVAAFLGLAAVDQVGLATAVSEIARNAFFYAGEAKVDFELELLSRPQFLHVRVTDRGPGIPDLQSVLEGKFQSKTGLGNGIAGARRLTERFDVKSEPNEGTIVSFGKALPNRERVVGMEAVSRLTRQLAQQPQLQDAIREQNLDLIETLQTLRDQDGELERRRLDLERSNLELEETNRGVVALYAELEERATALRRANELKTQFLSYVSHEFRTPVNSVMALTNLLLRRIDGELTSEQEKQVVFIRKAVEGLAEMVNDLLDLAKVESGKTEVRNVSVEVGQVLGAVRALMRPLATNDTVSLVFEESPPGVVIDTDATKLGQILRNLVSNALKFTEHGEVRVRVRCDSDDQRISFIVQDTGIGIAREHLELIFEEFAQINHSIQGHVKGTGLGLSLSRKLAELLGGSLHVSSEVGIGSTFTLTLPYATPVQPGQVVAERSGALNAGTSILIVDDEETSRYICRQMFRGTQYRIIESDGVAAAERARFERPDLIILDLIMPERSGFEVLDDLKADPATRDIPVVIHTSKIITDADAARLAGCCVGLLPKNGLDRKEALDAIRRALGDTDLFASEPEFVSSESDRGED